MVGMSKMQKQLYKKLLLRDIESIVGQGSGKNQTAMLNIVMQLRKCCVRPTNWFVAFFVFGQSVLTVAIASFWIISQSNRATPICLRVSKIGAWIRSASILSITAVNSIWLTSC